VLKKRKMKLDRHHKDLKHINRHIDCISETIPKRQSYAPYFILIALSAICLSVLFWFGPEMTGMVTFSESVTSVESGSFYMTESGIINVNTDLDNINSIMLSGIVRGKGKAAVFVVGPDRDHLAYYFEGDASSGESFKDMCYESCHMDGLSRSNTLKFELDGTSIYIDRVKYLYSRIIDFDLEPRSFEIDYKTHPASVIDLKLTNTELTDYTVLLYLDGPLSDSFSWQGSLIHMTADQPEKIIPITVKLPSNLEPGIYTHKITARYVPPGTHDFVGESPTAESFITVNN